MRGDKCELSAAKVHCEQSSCAYLVDFHFSLFNWTAPEAVSQKHSKTQVLDIEPLAVSHMTMRSTNTVRLTCEDPSRATVDGHPTTIQGGARAYLAMPQVGGEFAVSPAEQRRQIEALQTLETCLTALSAEQPDAFEGLSISIHHPDGDADEDDGVYEFSGKVEKVGLWRMSIKTPAIL